MSQRRPPRRLVRMSTRTDLAYAPLDTPLGTLIVAATQEGIVRLAFEDGAREAILSELAEHVSPDLREAPARLDATRRELDEYFEGTRTQFDLPLAPRGGSFDRAVWARVARIPYGETLSYGQVAGALGRPDRARAVGSANGRNPLPIVVP